MPFQFNEQHIADYYHHGFTVFRGVLPPSLVTDLRRMADAGRPIARERRGPQAQRLQPLSESGLDLQPYRDYCELPALNDALCRLLSPRHAHAGATLVGILYEPSDTPSFTNWHRDVTEATPGFDVAEFRRHNADPTFFNQVNCALYADCCTWYVPGSVNRPDTSGERSAAMAVPDLKDKTPAEMERLGHEYCSAMPGAIQLILEPGDFAIYRPTGWHIGNYAPYRKRATIHDAVWTPEAREWNRRWRAELEVLAKRDTKS